MAYIEVKNLSKDFTLKDVKGKSKPLHVLDDINLEIEKGEFVVLLGQFDASSVYYN